MKQDQTVYQKATRYLDNAIDILENKAKLEGKYYQDEKYVRMACGTAYSAVLIALDEYLKRKGKSIIKKSHQRVNIDDYKARLAQIDKKILNDLNTSYNILHLDGYYDGIKKYDIIQSGIESATTIVSKIKPN